MQPSTVLRVVDKIEGSAFLEIRRALQTVRSAQPNVTPDRASLVEGARGLAVIFKFPGGSLLAVPHGSNVPLSGEETRRLMANAGESKPGKSVQGSNIALIELAAIEFARKLPIDLHLYVISLVEEGSALVVIFKDVKASPRVRGSGGEPGFEVAFDRASGRMVRSNFIR